MPIMQVAEAITRQYQPFQQNDLVVAYNSTSCSEWADVVKTQSAQPD